MYSKENLYNLDSDDDELDFLRKGIDFAERAAVRKEYKEDAKNELMKNYDRKYPIKHFEKKYPANAKQQQAQTKKIEEEVEKQLNSMDSQDLKMALEREQNNETFKPDTARFFPNLDKGTIRKHEDSAKKYFNEINKNQALPHRMQRAEA